MKETLEQLVGRLLNLPKEKVAELYESDGETLKADAIDTLVAIDAARIKALKDAHKDELTKIHDEAYSKAKGESLAKWEKQIKDELGLQTDAKGLDLIKEAIAKNAKVEIDEEKIKLHPRYIELERKLNNEFISKAEYDKVKKEFDEFKTVIERGKVVDVVKQDAIRIFRSLKPVLSKDPARATNQESDFVEKLTRFDYDIQNDGNHVIMVDGKRLETSNGFSVAFADFVKSEAAKYFDFEVQDNRGNAGNNNNSGSSLNIVLPQSEAEYITMLAKEPDPHKQVALRNAWNAKNAK